MFLTGAVSAGNSLVGTTTGDLRAFGLAMAMWDALSTPQTLERTGELANVVRERVRQIEVHALALMKASPEMQALGKEYDFGGPQRRRLPRLVRRPRTSREKPCERCLPRLPKKD